MSTESSRSKLAFETAEERLIDAAADRALEAVRREFGSYLSTKEYEVLGERIHEALIVRLEVVRR
jgi:hypothetical protein